MSSLIEQLKEAAKGLEIEPRLAAHGLSKSTFYRALRGGAAPSVTWLCAVAKALDLRIEITPAAVTVEPWGRRVDQTRSTSTQ